MKTENTSSKVIENYNAQYALYNRLGSNLQQALEEFLTEKNIPFLQINYRVKTIESVLEKIERKEYENPLSQIEDFCGLRIICYYRNDIGKICDLLKDELTILEFQDKEEALNQNEFGYRSVHLIATVPNSWMSAPNYRGLDNLKIEIQVRTILMHAWAEIQHKLAYKKEEHLDVSMRREFSFLSAKLEEADLQFENLKNNSQKIQQEFKKDISNNGEIQLQESSVNLDSLVAFLDVKFPNRLGGKKDPLNLLDELLKAQITFDKIESSLEQTLDFINEEIEKKEDFQLTKSGVVRMALNLTEEEFWKNTKENTDRIQYKSWVEKMTKLRNKIK